MVQRPVICDPLVYKEVGGDVLGDLALLPIFKENVTNIGILLTVILISQLTNTKH